MAGPTFTDDQPDRCGRTLEPLRVRSAPFAGLRADAENSITSETEGSVIVTVALMAHTGKYTKNKSVELANSNLAVLSTNRLVSAKLKKSIVA